MRAPATDYGFFDPIVDVQSMIGGLYVEEPDIDKLQIGAIEGMLEELNDPYTTYRAPPATPRSSHAI